jgi:hypothetical protein
MFVPLEIVDELGAYMGNRDLVNMARVCKHWNPTCMRRVSTHLTIGTRKSSKQTCQKYLANFNGSAHHPDAPTDPKYVKVLSIHLDLEMDKKTGTGVDFDSLYALLNYVGHVRYLELDAMVYYDQLDLLNTLCKVIAARLPNIKYLKLTCKRLFGGDDDDWSEDIYQPIFERMAKSFQPAILDLHHEYPFDPTAMLNGQASTLVELDMELAILYPFCDFGVLLLPCLKKLTLCEVTHMDDLPDSHIANGQALNFGKAFPLLEYLFMETRDLGKYGGEEFSNILHMASTCPQLNYLELDMSPALTVLPDTPSLVFSNLKTLVLYSGTFMDEHMCLLVLGYKNHLSYRARECSFA